MYLSTSLVEVVNTFLDYRPLPRSGFFRACMIPVSPSRIVYRKKKMGSKRDGASSTQVPLRENVFLMSDS